VSKSIAIVGSGKMAKDIGMFFLKKGNAITWISRQEELLIDLQATIDKSVRLFMKYSGGTIRQLSASFLLCDELEKDRFDVVIECTKEDVTYKKEVLAYLEGHVVDEGLLFSASSSILPSLINEVCIGFHPMFPFEMTTMAEIVVGEKIGAKAREAAVMFCKENDVECICQNEQNAFALNRLFLPLQNEVFVALQTNVSARDANSASKSSLLPTGQIDFIEKIGPHVVAASVDSYRQRMGAKESALFMPLSVGLASFETFVHTATQAPLMPDGPFNVFKRKLLCLFVNTCLDFVDQHQILRQELDSAFSDVFSADCTLQDTIDEIGMPTIAALCEAEYKKTGKNYFKPSSLLYNRPHS